MTAIEQILSLSAIAGIITSILVFFLKRWITSIDKKNETFETTLKVIADKINSIEKDDALCRQDKQGVNKITFKDFENSMNFHHERIEKLEKESIMTNERLLEGDRRFESIDSKMDAILSKQGTYEKILIELASMVKSVLDNNIKEKDN